MRRFITPILVAIVGITGAVGTGSMVGRAFRSKPTKVESPPSLRIPSGDLDFGEVWEQDKLVWPITIENTSDNAKDITGLGGSCTCQSFAPTAFTLQPGERQQVEVTLTLRSNRSKASNKSTEEFVTSMWAHVRGEANTANWILRGKIRSAVRCPDRLDLGQVSVLAPEAGKIEFWIEERTDLSTLDVTADSPVVQVAVSRQKNWHKVTVTPTSGLDRRVYATGLLLKPICSDGQELPCVSIPLRFEVGSDLVAVPDRVNFGHCSEGETQQETITIRSLSGRTMVVTNSATAGVGLSVRRTGHPSGLVYEIEQLMVRDQAAKHEVKFLLKDEHGGADELVVPVVYAVPGR